MLEPRPDPALIDEACDCQLCRALLRFAQAVADEEDRAAAERRRTMRVVDPRSTRE